MDIEERRQAGRECSSSGSKQQKSKNLDIRRLFTRSVGPNVARRPAGSLSGQPAWQRRAPGECSTAASCPGIRTHQRAAIQSKRHAQVDNGQQVEAKRRKASGYLASAHSVETGANIVKQPWSCSTGEISWQGKACSTAVVGRGLNGSHPPQLVPRAMYVGGSRASCGTVYSGAGHKQYSTSLQSEAASHALPLISRRQAQDSSIFCPAAGSCCPAQLQAGFAHPPAAVDRSFSGIELSSFGGSGPRYDASRANVLTPETHLANDAGRSATFNSKSPVNRGTAVPTPLSAHAALAGTPGTVTFSSGASASTCSSKHCSRLQQTPSAQQPSLGIGRPCSDASPASTLTARDAGSSCTLPATAIAGDAEQPDLPAKEKPLRLGLDDWGLMPKMVKVSSFMICSEACNSSGPLA